MRDNGRFIPLTQQDITRITKYVKEHNVKPIVHFVGPVADCVDCMCPFLGQNNKCVIYDFRPTICKAFRCNLPPTEIVKRLSELGFTKTQPVCNMRRTFFPESLTENDKKIHAGMLMLYQSVANGEADLEFV